MLRPSTLSFCWCCALFDLWISLDAASLILEKYEDDFIDVVNPKLKLRWLKRKKVLTDSLITDIESADTGNAVELLFEHLRLHADVATLREYCKMVITADAYPKMQKLGKKMLSELPPEGLL